MKADTKEIRIAVIGLGYVGLPVAVGFGRIYDTLGFDIDTHRVAELRAGYDDTREVTSDELKSARHLQFSSQAADLSARNIYIVTVPTPITDARVPDLGPIIAASEAIAPHLKLGDIVIYESTVYPGATEEVCVPLLECGSDLSVNEDFFVGYSPERANPGDREHRLDTITKVVAGSTADIADRIGMLYSEVVSKGVYKASSIRVAEAAKVIENVQRDINVALINELAMIFGRMEIDIEEVLEAAGTKWNFLPFRPGLVGGHCIGVDPYYLTYKAQTLGYHPEMILAGRRINDGMGRYVAGELIRLMVRKRIHIDGSRVLVMGLTFKENTPDIRNTRVIDIVEELRSVGAQVDVYDPWADAKEVQSEYGIVLNDGPEPQTYDAAVIAVAHREFRALGSAGVRAFCKPKHVLYDVKYSFPASEVDGRL